MKDANSATQQPDRETRHQIDEICDAFESAWMSRQRPKIESFLSRVDESSREALLLELLPLEIEYRIRQGDSVNVAEYLERFQSPQAVASIVRSELERSGKTGNGQAREELENTQVHDPDTLFSTSQSLADSTQLGESVPEDSTDGGEDAVPERIGRYSVEKTLGAGAFGIVLLANDDELQRRVAIKVPKHVGDEGSLQAYLDEARRVATLDHPSIVPVYDFGRSADGSCYVVSKFVDGNDLNHRMRESQIPRDEAIDIVATIAEALHFAHKQGFVHRDIKPANILLDAHERPYLTDFGLAVHEEELRDRRGEVSGSPSYMAPEQVRGRTEQMDGRADIWALGVLLYRLLCGRPPFTGRNMEELFDEISKREVKPLRMIDESIPIDLEKIVLRCLEKKVQDRYSSANDLAKELRAWMADQTQDEFTASGTVRVEVAQNIQAQLVTVILALVVVGMLGGLGWLFFGGTRTTLKPGPQPGVFANVTVPATGPANSPSEDPNGQPSEQPVDSPVEPIVLTGEIDLLVWRPENDDVRGMSIRDAAALPLSPGDQLRVEATLATPAYPYVVWIDTNGEAFPVYPWEPGNWSSEYQEEKRKYLSLPETTELADNEIGGWPLAGGPGMETLVLMVRAEPLPAEVDLQTLFDGFPKQDMQDKRSLIWLDNGEVSQRRDRGPQFFNVQAVKDPLLVSQRLLARRLEEHFPVVRAVAVANRGPESKSVE